MNRHRAALGLALLVLVSLPRGSWSQGIPVYDNVNALQNLVSLANDALNLLPLDVIVVVDNIGQDLTTVNDIIVEANQVGLDVQSLQVQINTLFNLQTAPATSSALRDRVAQIRQAKWLVSCYAMRVQTLFSTFGNTLRHLDQLLGSIASLAGAKQGIQVLNQKVALLVYVQTSQATQQATYQQAQLYDQMEQQVIAESMRRINQNLMRDHP